MSSTPPPNRRRHDGFPPGNEPLLPPDAGFDTPFSPAVLEEMAQLYTDDGALEEYVEGLHQRTHAQDLKRGEYYPEILRAVLGLKEVVAEALGIEVSQVQPNFGSNGSIDTILLAAKFVELRRQTGGGILTSSPTYFRVYNSAAARQLQLHFVPLAADYTLDAAQFTSEMKRLQPSAIMLITPNNPTGIPIPDADLLHILDELPLGTWAVIDRTLVNVRPEITTSELLRRYADRNLVVLHSFSKYKSMSQHRVGVALYSNARFARTVEPLLPLGLALEPCVKATRYVRRDGGIVPNQNIIDNIRAAKDVLTAFCAAHPEFHVTDFSGNYALLELPPTTDARIVTAALAGKGLYVMGGDEFPEPNPRVIRIHVGGPPDPIREVCALLVQNDRP